MKEIWIAVNLDSLHVLEHEGDYNEGAVLVHMKPTPTGPEFRIVLPEAGQ